MATNAYKFSFLKPRVPNKELPENITNYINTVLDISVEFRLLEAILEWFVEDKLTIPQMVFLFPTIIPLMSSSPVLIPLAEAHKTLKVPNNIPKTPGERAVFGMLETMVLKSLMVPPDIKPTESPIQLSVTVKTQGATLLGWRI